MRFAGQILGSFLLIRFRRLHLLSASCLLVSAGMTLLATSAYFNSGEVVVARESAKAFLGAAPLIAVVIVALAYHIGLGPIPWSYTGTAKNSVIVQGMFYLLLFFSRAVPG